MSVILGQLKQVDVLEYALRVVNHFLELGEVQLTIVISVTQFDHNLILVVLEKDVAEFTGFDVIVTRCVNEIEDDLESGIFQFLFCVTCSVTTQLDRPYHSNAPQECLIVRNVYQTLVVKVSLRN